VPGFQFDHDDPLGRAKGESRKANEALWRYWLQGTGRSLRGLLGEFARLASDGSQTEIPPTTSWGTLTTWSIRLRWQDRIARQEERQRAKEEAEWDARRRWVREQDWEQGQALRELAGRILAEGPNFLKTRRKVTKDGREIVTVALDAGLAVRAAEKGSQLQRLGAEMETERQKVVLALEKEIDAILDALSRVLDYDDYQRVLAAIVALDSAGAGREKTQPNTES
jgi:hypothetical protein